MNIKLSNILKLTTVAVTLLFTSESAYSETWYICAGGDWDIYKCGYYNYPTGPYSSSMLGVRWSYKECKNFGDYVVTVPHKSDVNQTNSNTWTSECEVEPAGPNHPPAHTQGQKKEHPKGGKP